jgi:hypothetical protein
VTHVLFLVRHGRDELARRRAMVNIRGILGKLAFGARGEKVRRSG